MHQFYLALILFLGGISYYLWNENTTLVANNAKLEGAVQLQEETISSLQNDFATQMKGKWYFRRLLTLFRAVLAMHAEDVEEYAEKIDKK